MLFGGEGKSSIRAGYSISYLHDGGTTFTNALGTGTTNPGLIQSANQARLNASGVPDPTAPLTNVLPGVLTAAGVPLVTPSFKIPITDRDNILVNSGNGLWTIDPNIKIPFVHQYSFGIEREIMKDTAIEIRYVGNRSTNLWRAIDINQTVIKENGFLNEFLNAQANLAAHGGTNFAPGCVGCLPTPILDKFFSGFASTSTSGYQSATFISNLNNNNIGSMAFTLANSTTYRTNRENPTLGLPANFFLANPNANFALYLSNGAQSSYNAMEVEIRRRFSNGLQFQANYTWSKAMVLGDAQGNNQSDFIEPIDLHNLQLDKRRSSQDQTQRFVANTVYELPFGKGHAWLSDSNWAVNRLLGGWSLGGIVTWSTGVPFYITSGRTTIQAYAATGAQLTGISFADFKNAIGIFKDPRGVFFINPNLLDITVNAAGKATSSKLKAGLMAAPAPGTLGNFPVNALSGPQYFSVDLSLVKRIPITERVRFEFKVNANNVFNHPSFAFGTQNFDSSTFGLINSTRIGGRAVNFIGQIRF
jgi:hypothetical protein